MAMNYFVTKRKKWIAGLTDDENKNPFKEDLSALNKDLKKVGKDMGKAIDEIEEIEDKNGEER